MSRANVSACGIACIAILASLFAPVSALYTAQTPATTQWDARNGKGNPFNVDIGRYPFAKVVTGDAPEQITVTYQSPTSVVIAWVSGDAQYYTYSNASDYVAPTTAGKQSIVKYGPYHGTVEYNASATPYTFSQNYYTPGYGEDFNYNYTSGLINQVPLMNLTPSTEYYYVVGNGLNWSLPYSFRTLQAVSTNFTPYRIGVVADVGITANSTKTIEHLAESLPDVITLIGDWCYADNLIPNGSISNTVNYTGSVSLTYPPTWDQFYRWWSTLTSNVPFVASNGNHEYEQDAYGKTFNTYNARYNQTSDLSKSGNSRYYSVEMPGIHYIFLSPYDPYNVSSPQYNWLQNDLASFNRSRTQWLVVQFHTPMYNTYVSHYKEVECARLAWEPLFFQYGVDLVMHGHVHSYERTNRVYNYQVSACAPMYITIGDGGNIEQLAVPMVDVPGNCPAPSLASSPGSKFQGNCLRYSLQTQYANVTSDGYCPTQQPDWSAYREPSFGHGTLDVSPTALAWNWHRNQDAEPVVWDTYTILPKDSYCPNAGQAAPALAPLPAGFTPSQLAPIQAQPPSVSGLPAVDNPPFTVAPSQSQGATASAVAG